MSYCKVRYAVAVTIDINHQWDARAERSRRMISSSNENIFRVTGPISPVNSPVMQIVDVFFDLRRNKMLSKQPWGWWFKTPSRSLWRNCLYGQLQAVIHLP